MLKTGIVRDPIYIQHDMGPYHPESPERLVSIYAMLDSPEMNGRFVPVPIREATKAEICANHNESYYETIVATKGLTRRLDPDTSTSPESVTAVLKAVGGTLNALDLIMEGRIDNGFSLVRPPGHHAEAGRAMGFCIFNNIAVAAHHALRRHGCKRVAIMDWDVHHGNGTQNSFFSTNEVFYLSTHQYPFYPGSGTYNEVGWGDGTGYTLNVPMSPGYGDGDYYHLFEKLITPPLLEYRPDVLLVSAGFDNYLHDPIGGMNVTPGGFEGMLHLLMEVAQACCDGKILLVLEGGYNVNGQTESIKQCLETLQRPVLEHPKYSFLPDQPEMLTSMITRIKNVHQQYWKSLTP